MLNKLKKIIGNVIQLIKDSIEKRDSELEKWKEEDPESYYDYMLNIYDKKP